MEINNIIIDTDGMTTPPKITRWDMPDEIIISIETPCGTLVIRIPEKKV